MRLSTFSDYSLRVLIFLGSRPGERVTIDQIAAAYRISRNHLMKVVGTLGRIGLIGTVRGRGGGMALARPAESVRLGDVLRQTERGDALVECLDNRQTDCPLCGVCPLTPMFEEAREAFFETMNRFTLADACARPDMLALRLEQPNVS
ncbi:RrF2 family transcriptional regulator [Novispirillum sp. DQ9]|uniref:RrF2 family transcriptional regulator n=1 Tax=Novispirillum sp. DQ9 TaxID=3398612 RepID=UPI003C7A1D33